MKHGKGEATSRWARHFSVFRLCHNDGVLLKREGIRCLALLAALAVGGGITVAVTASRAGASSEFTLGSHLTNLEFITAQAGPSTSIPASPMVPGDRVVTRDDLTQNGSPVGHLEAMCTVTFNNEFMCESIAALTNRGDLHASFLARASQPGVLGSQRCTT